MRLARQLRSPDDQSNLVAIRRCRCRGVITASLPRAVGG